MVKEVSPEVPEPATVLALDTALGACSVAIGRSSPTGGAILAAAFEPLKRGHAEALMPMIDRVSASAGVALDEIDLFAVTVGPGTFTGVRIGLAAARGLALALDRPLKGFSTLEAMAWGAARLVALPAPLLVVHDARREEVYAQLFYVDAANPGGEMVTPLSSPRLVNLAEIPALLPAAPIWLSGSGAGLALAALPAGHSAKMLPGAAVNPEAAILAHLAGRTYAFPAPGRPRGYFAGPAVLPLYLRAPDAKLPGGVSL